MLNSKIQYIFDQFLDEDSQFFNDCLVFSEPIYRKFATRNKLPVGFIEADIHEGYNEIYLNIAVVPKCRKQGIAQKLFAKFLDWFVKTNYDAVLWNTHRDNMASTQLAIKLGFTEFFPPQHKHNKMRFFALGRKNNV